LASLVMVRLREYRYHEPKTTGWRFETLKIHLSYCKVLFSIIENSVAPL
jgi:hypothetical protein